MAIEWIKENKGTKEYYFLLVYICYVIFIYGRFITLAWAPPATYVNEQFGYSIQYPANWISSEFSNGYKNKNDLSVSLTNGDYVALAKPTTKGIEVHHKTFENGTLADVAQWNSELQKITGGSSQLHPPKNITIGLYDYPAVMVEYKKGMLRHAKHTSVYLLIGQNGYIISYSSSPWVPNTVNNREIFENALNSFDASFCD